MSIDKAAEMSRKIEGIEAVHKYYDQADRMGASKS
jgi:hypothetical protein